MYEYKKRDKSETTTMYYYYMYLLFVSFWFCLQNIYKSGNQSECTKTNGNKFNKISAIVEFQWYGVLCLWYAMVAMACDGNANAIAYSTFSIS